MAEHHRVVCRESAEGSTVPDISRHSFSYRCVLNVGEWGNDPMHSYFHAHPSIAHSLPLAPVSFSFVVVFPWFFPISPSFSVFFHGLSRFSMVSLGFSMVFPWFFHGVSMVFPIFDPGFSGLFIASSFRKFPLQGEAQPLAEPGGLAGGSRASGSERSQGRGQSQGAEDAGAWNGRWMLFISHLISQWLIICGWWLIYVYIYIYHTYEDIHVYMNNSSPKNPWNIWII